jgi:proteasome accessory factor B
LPLVVEMAPDLDPPVEGYRIDRKKYYLTIPPMEADELAALRLATTLFRVGDTNAEQGLYRLGGLVPVVGDVDGSTPLATVAIAKGLGELFQARTDRATVQFTYYGEKRTLDPMRLDLRDGRWYVSGYDHDRDAARTFRVDKIVGPIVVDRPGSFTRRDDLDVPGPVPPWMFSNDTEVTAHIAVDPNYVEWAVAQTDGRATVERRADGSAVLSMTASNHDGLRWFVLELLDHGELLEPEFLRQDLIAWLEAQL